ncbi:MAG: hypothetical protein ABEJ23_09430 [Haloarculaceae archaeon]
MHPVAAAFYHDHGIDVRTCPPWAPAFFDGVDVTETEGHVCVVVTLDGDRLEATLDDDLVIDLAD